MSEFFFSLLTFFENLLFIKKFNQEHKQNKNGKNLVPILYDPTKIARSNNY